MRNLKMEMLAEPLRVCNDCGCEAYTIEDLDLFTKSDSSEHGRMNLCRKCRTKRSQKTYKANHKRYYEYDKQYRKNKPFEYTVKLLKSRSKKKGYDFDLTADYLKKIAHECDYICPMTGFKMLQGLKRNNPFSMSIDRINPDKGYTKENVRLVAYCYNLARSNWGDDFTLEMCQRVVERARASIR